jgi:hypothetical protein
MIMVCLPAHRPVIQSLQSVEGVSNADDKSRYLGCQKQAVALARMPTRYGNHIYSPLLVDADSEVNWILGS